MAQLDLGYISINFVQVMELRKKLVKLQWKLAIYLSSIVLLFGMLYTTYKYSYKAGQEEMTNTIIGVCFDLTANEPLIIQSKATGKTITCQQLTLNASPLH